MITDASIELTGVKCDLETCMNEIFISVSKPNDTTPAFAVRQPDTTLIKITRGAPNLAVLTAYRLHGFGNPTIVEFR